MYRHALLRRNGFPSAARRGIQFIHIFYAVLGLSFLLATALLAAPKKEYLTEDELDLVRDAQEINLRVPVYLRLAEKRLIFLGLMEKGQKEIERERKEREKWEKEKKKAEKSGDKTAAQKEPVDEYVYLEDFTRSELLRGYIQTLDEVMDNIDDAYTRRLDVRDPLENLEEFTRETAPLLEKFQPKNDSERLAIEEAVDKAKSALNDAKEALNIVPKTEKKAKKR